MIPVDATPDCRHLDTSHGIGRLILLGLASIPSMCGSCMGKLCQARVEQVVQNHIHLWNLNEIGQVDRIDSDYLGVA